MSSSFDRPSAVDAERAWAKLREGVEKFERASRHEEADKAFSELLVFEKEHMHLGINFADLHARFDAKHTPNVAEIERRWMELRRKVDSIPKENELAKAQAEDALYLLEIRYPKLELKHLENNLQPVGKRFR